MIVYQKIPLILKISIMVCKIFSNMLPKRNLATSIYRNIFLVKTRLKEIQLNMKFQKEKKVQKEI